MAKAWRLAMTKDKVLERLGFAESRLEEFLALNGGDLAGASVSARQQLLQEFFFHLVGAIEMLAQLVNETRALGIDPEEVSVLKVGQTLTSTDPVHAPLSALHTPTRGRALPANPYDDTGYIFRIYNYRHQVTHRGTNVFLFRVGPDFERDRSASLILDPRDAGSGFSNKTVQDEMRYMHQLVRGECTSILAFL